MRAWLCFIIIALVTSCEENEFKPVYRVPESLQPFIDKFIFEANARGHNIEITNLIISFDDNMSSPTCATCNSNNPQAEIQKTILINSDVCYKNQYEQEALLFHELGHCVLGRDHLNELLPNGDPKSLMVQNDIHIYAPCEYQIDEEECNKVGRRSYYVDELFDTSVPIPEWGQ